VIEAGDVVRKTNGSCRCSPGRCVSRNQKNAKPAPCQLARESCHGSFRPTHVKERHRDKDAGRIRLVRGLQQATVADQGWHLCSNGVETLHQTGVPHKMAVFLAHECGVVRIVAGFLRITDERFRNR